MFATLCEELGNNTFLYQPAKDEKGSWAKQQMNLCSFESIDYLDDSDFPTTLTQYQKGEG